MILFLFLFQFQLLLLLLLTTYYLQVTINMSTFNQNGSGSSSTTGGSADDTSIFDIANMLDTSSSELKYSDNCYFDPTQNHFYGQSKAPSQVDQITPAVDPDPVYTDKGYNNGGGADGYPDGVEDEDEGGYGNGNGSGYAAELDWVALAERVDMQLQNLRPGRSFSAEALLCALQTHLDLDQDLSAEGACALLDSQLAAAAESLACTDRRLVDSRPPCRHLMQGRCYRRDCSFEHDLASVTCTYWLTSGCANGDNCYFSHALARVEAPGAGEEGADGAAQAAPYVEEENAFPSLAASTGVAAGAGAGTGAAPTADAYMTAFRTDSWAPPPAPAPAPADRRVATFSAGEAGAELLEVGSWVSSGRAVAADYAAQRAEAAALAAARNTCFHQATQAYLG
mgnify:CR=1 FL=1